MKLLLDTHILVWSLTEPDRLVPSVADILNCADTEIWISPVSAWECVALTQKGRLELLPDPARWFRTAMRQMAAREAPMNCEVALLSATIGLAHRDPADRFLAATAAIYGLTLTTSDARLLQGTGYGVLANR